MNDKFTEDELRSIRVALRMLADCATAEEVYALIEEFRELGIDYECVGTVTVGRLGLLGVDSREERYKEVERFFKFKTVDDYYAASWEEKRRWMASPTMRIE